MHVETYVNVGPNSNLTEGAFHQTYSWKIDKGAKVDFMINCSVFYNMKLVCYNLAENYSNY